MKINYILPIFLITLLVSIQLNAQCSKDSETTACCTKESCSEAHTHPSGPIGLMNDHCHPKGGLMLSFRFMDMNMKGNRSEDKEISNASIFQTYMLAPEEMDMRMYMLGVMYGLTDRLTLMGMTNYQENQMTMTAMDDRTHVHQSAGFGDFNLMLISSLWQQKNQSLHANLGMSFPFGNISMTEVNHLQHHQGHEGAMETPMPYPMRLGSGTYDLILGATYALHLNKFAYGLQFDGKLRTNTTDRDYQLGNVLRANTWLTYQATSWVNVSLRANGNFSQKINEKDGELMAMMSPPNDVVNSGGTQINSFLGFNILVPKFWNGLQIGAEYGLPLYQKVNGIQMNREGALIVGLKLNII